MLALSRGHAENPVELYIVQAIAADNLCNFGKISSKQWKVIAISVSEPHFYVRELRHVFKSQLGASSKGATKILYVLWASLNI